LSTAVLLPFCQFCIGCHRRAAMGRDPLALLNIRSKFNPSFFLSGLEA
jgi:hypothetical protein